MTSFDYKQARALTCPVMAVTEEQRVNAESVCIECGQRSPQGSFRKYTGGSIQLSKCEGCDNFVDRYLEYDAVILMLDIVLLRIEAFRHMLFNYRVKTSLLCRLAVVLVLCDSYIKMRLLHVDSNSFVVLQFHFHLSFVQALLEFMLLLVSTYFVVAILAAKGNIPFSINHILKVILITNYSKICAIVTLIWVDEDQELYDQSLLIFTMPAQYEAYRALLYGSCSQCALLVLSQNILMLIFNRTSTVLRLAVLDTYSNDLAL